ncbi:DUF2332 family protein [Roseomonas sp. OT10]|uniref:DUF2332 domain-containing protein n=1 Tax=Roseomonas cutis TaxID=2897332 RepID=UPI001E48A929|nr:DUF2332 family protein [Roseomonas sp. OT10]UFN46914.1 DUF2332 family protein [Roseomonas sp. OT10]
MGEATTEAVLAAFGKQVGWCEQLGSPFTARLLRALAAQIAASGPAAGLVANWPGDPVADALALRLAGGLHALVLAGEAPELASHYPPHDPAERGTGLEAALPAAVAAHAAWLGGFLASPPQTNEVARAAILLGGFLTVARETGLPLRLLEIGASAGLNSLWDRFHYRLGDAAWGDPDSPVRLAPDWPGGLPPLDAPLRIEGRRACDLSPVALEDPAQRLRLRAYVWADQSERLARLDGAIALARRFGTAVEAADAAAWVPARLAERQAGEATVLFHSIMWLYLPAPAQAAIAGALAAAGAGATPDAPLAWLRFETPPGTERPELRLTLWPDGTERRLARGDAHGRKVEWLAG